MIAAPGRDGGCISTVKPKRRTRRASSRHRYLSSLYVLLAVETGRLRLQLSDKATDYGSFLIIGKMFHQTGCNGTTMKREPVVTT